MNDLEISVIIPTYNRAESLRETLLALLSQTMEMESFEVIVVDDGSSDDTIGVIGSIRAEYPLFNLRYQRHETNRFKPAACNTGLAMAMSDILAFTDDDIRPVPGWLESHVRMHRIESREVCVIGLVLYPEEWECKSNWTRFANDNYRRSAVISRSSLGSLPPHRFAGGNVSIRRDTLMRIGAFDESMRRGQDVELGWRIFQANIPILYQATAIVYHYAEAIKSISDTLHQFRRFYSTDRNALFMRHPLARRDFGHWFLESVDTTYDNQMRRAVKTFVRLIAHRPLLHVALWVVRTVDAIPILYWRPLYQYVMVCEAVDCIRKFDRD